MFILSSNGASLVDATGLDIRTVERQMEDGNFAVVGFELVGFGFGYSVTLGTYAMEKQARDIFNDILVHMKKGKTEFYDVREQEKKFQERWS